MDNNSGHDHKIRAQRALDAAYAAMTAAGESSDPAEQQGQTNAAAALTQVALVESNLYLADTLFHLRDHIEELPARLKRAGGTQ